MSWWQHRWVVNKYINNKWGDIIQCVKKISIYLSWNCLLVSYIFIWLGVYPNCACKLGKVYDHKDSVSGNQIDSFCRLFFFSSNTILDGLFNGCLFQYFRFAWTLIAQNVQREVSEAFPTVNAKKGINSMMCIGTVALGIWMTHDMVTLVQPLKHAQYSIYGTALNASPFVVQTIEQDSIRTV